MGDGGRWALVSPDGVAPSRLVGVSASVNLPLHHKVQKFSSGIPAHPGGPGKRAVKWLCGCGIKRSGHICDRLRERVWATDVGIQRMRRRRDCFRRLFLPVRRPALRVCKE